MAGVTEELINEFNRLGVSPSKTYPIETPTGILTREVRQLVIGDDTLITLTTGGNTTIPDRASIKSLSGIREVKEEDLPAIRAISTPETKTNSQSQTQKSFLDFLRK